MIITVSVVSFAYRRDCVWLLFIGSRDMIAKVNPIVEIPDIELPTENVQYSS
jgi:hypothetical protein